MVSTVEILQGMKNRVLEVCDTVYTQERPAATDGGLNAFVVVSIPVSFVERIEGATMNWWTRSTAQFAIYVKDRATASNPNQMNIPKTDELLGGIMGLFPFKIEGSDMTYNITKPELVFAGRSDEKGFHLTLIQATLTTI